MNQTISAPLHQPVMLAEVLATFKVEPATWYIDATFGRGGHTQALLNHGARVIAFDWDEEAITFGQQRFAAEIAAQKLILIRENFDHLAQSVAQLNLSSPIKGILFDFGTSVDQLTSSTRGFSFQGAGELDMRMDNRLGVKAKDLLALLSEKQLAEIFFKQGGELEARKIAKEIVAQRHQGHFLTTVQELAELVRKVKKEPRKHLHPATKVFQALRIIVNSELESIAQALPQVLTVMTTGIVVTIAFHEGEDRIIKNTFQEWEKKGLGKNLYKHPLTPTQEEQHNNSRSRSAKLRAFKL